MATDNIASSRKVGMSFGSTLEETLTGMVHDFIDALNARPFKPDPQPWTYLSDDFKAHLSYAGWSRDINGRESLGNFFKVFVDTFPDYFVRIVDVAFDFNARTGRASLFANMKTDGIPLGVLRSSVGAYDFKPLGGGRWQCVRYRCMPGIFAASEGAAEWM